MIEVLDLGVSNVSSVVSAFDEVSKHRVRVIDSKIDSSQPELLVIPGNGTFEAGMRQLKSSGLDQVVSEHYQHRGKKVVGLCLGMQLMGKESEESPVETGLGLVRGRTRHLESLNQKSETVPRIGWHEVFWDRDHEEKRLLNHNLGEHMFFAHSYHLELSEMNVSRLITRFGDETYTAGFISDRLCGLQFHPEKSSFAGLRLLRQIIDWAGIESD